MRELDRIYLNILHYGLVAIRNSTRLGDLDHAQHESEHLHEIPTLIGHDRVGSHLFYTERSRGTYLEWVRTSNNQHAKALVSHFYFASWDQLDRLIEQLKGEEGAPTGRSQG